MQTYDLLKDWYKDDKVRELTAKGVISMTVLDYLTYYEYFLEGLKTLTKGQSVKATADEFCVGNTTVRRAVKIMES